MVPYYPFKNIFWTLEKYLVYKSCDNSYYIYYEEEVSMRHKNVVLFVLIASLFVLFACAHIGVPPPPAGIGGTTAVLRVPGCG